MKFNYQCLNCHINQALKSSAFMKCSDETRETIIREVLKGMSTFDYSKKNPELMTKTWDTITESCGNEDPYKAFKTEYNETLMSIAPLIEESINKLKHPLFGYLYAAILGNVIDLGPSHAFESDNWLATFNKELSDIHLATNHSDAFFNELGQASTLLYIGDNCGEIVMDKLFINALQKKYPNLSITFAVRGKAVLNDVTYHDADEIGLSTLVPVIQGSPTPGTILSMCDSTFMTHFNESDIIIAKGQGNFEGLSDQYDPRIFHLFMAKCDLVANTAGVKNMSKICYRQHTK